MGDLIKSLFSCFHRTKPEEELQFAVRQLIQLVKYEKMHQSGPRYISKSLKFGLYYVPPNTPAEENVTMELLKKDYEILIGLKDVGDVEEQRTLHTSLLDGFIDEEKKAPDELKASLEELTGEVPNDKGEFMDGEEADQETLGIKSQQDSKEKVDDEETSSEESLGIIDTYEKLLAKEEKEAKNEAPDEESKEKLSQSEVSRETEEKEATGEIEDKAADESEEKPADEIEENEESEEKKNFKIENLFETIIVNPASRSKFVSTSPIVNDFTTEIVPRVTDSIPESFVCRPSISPKITLLSTEKLKKETILPGPQYKAIRALRNTRDSKSIAVSRKLVSWEEKNISRALIEAKLKRAREYIAPGSTEASRISTSKEIDQPEISSPSKKVKVSSSLDVVPPDAVNTAKAPLPRTINPLCTLREAMGDAAIGTTTASTQNTTETASSDFQPPETRALNGNEKSVLEFISSSGGGTLNTPQSGGEKVYYEEDNRNLQGKMDKHHKSQIVPPPKGFEEKREGCKHFMELVISARSESGMNSKITYYGDTELLEKGPLSTVKGYYKEIQEKNWRQLQQIGRLKAGGNPSDNDKEDPKKVSSSTAGPSRENNRELPNVNQKKKPVNVVVASTNLPATRGTTTIYIPEQKDPDIELPSEELIDMKALIVETQKLNTTSTISAKQDKHSKVPGKNEDSGYETDSRAHIEIGNKNTSDAAIVTSNTTLNDASSVKCTCGEAGGTLMNNPLQQSSAEELDQRGPSCRAVCGRCKFKYGNADSSQ